MAVPPLIKQNSLIGFYRFFKKPVDFLNVQFEQYSDTIRFKLPGRILIGSRDPDLFEHIFVKNQKNYNKTFSSEQLGLALGKGLLTNSGESWLRQRRLIQPVFYKKRTESMAEKIEELADAYIAQLNNLPEGHLLHVDEEMMTLTATIVLETLLGEKFNPETEQLKHTITSLQNYLVKRIRIPFYKELSVINGTHADFEKKLHSLDSILYRMISKKKKQQDEESNDMISMLLNISEQDTGEKMSDKQLRDELLTIYVAGHETSAYALSWTLYELVQHPEIYQKVREEVGRTLVHGKIGISGLKELKYTTAVINESMRLHPPAYFVTRSCISDDRINDTEIKENDNIIFSIIGMHRHPGLWKAPDTFVPERFLSPDDSVKKYFHPFGAGPRMCIGNHFAMMEITIILAKLVAHFNFKPANQQPVEIEPLITLKPKNGIFLIKT